MLLVHVHVIGSNQLPLNFSLTGNQLLTAGVTISFLVLMLQRATVSESVTTESVSTRITGVMADGIALMAVMREDAVSRPTCVHYNCVTYVGYYKSDDQSFIRPVTCNNYSLHYCLLALLDYVSRAHEIEIRPASVRRPSVASIIS